MGRLKVIEVVSKSLKLKNFNSFMGRLKEGSGVTSTGTDANFNSFMGRLKEDGYFERRLYS